MGRGNSLSDPGLSVSESLSRRGTLRFVCCLLGWSSHPVCALALPGASLFLVIFCLGGTLCVFLGTGVWNCT